MAVPSTNAPRTNKVNARGRQGGAVGVETSGDLGYSIPDGLRSDLRRHGQRVDLAAPHLEDVLAAPVLQLLQLEALVAVPLLQGLGGRLSVPLEARLREQLAAPLLREPHALSHHPRATDEARGEQQADDDPRDATR